MVALMLDSVDDYRSQILCYGLSKCFFVSIAAVLVRDKLCSW